MTLFNPGHKALCRGFYIVGGEPWACTICHPEGKRQMELDRLERKFQDAIALNIRERHERIRQLWHQGWKKSQIAKEVGMTRQGVHARIQALGLA